MSKKQSWVEQDIIDAFNTTIGSRQLTKMFTCDWACTMRPIWVKTFGESAIKERACKLASLAKLGNKNPMFGKKGLLHHNAVAFQQRNGYIYKHIPSWFTGKASGSTIAEHTIIYCSINNMTEIPEGFLVHHVDGDRANNNPTNLIMLSISDHMKLHAFFRKGATTIPQREYNSSELEARDTL